MNLVRSEYPWHDLAACYATVTRTELKDIFDYCGHDGSGIIFPELPDPRGRRGFHSQELIDFCLQNNYHVTTIGASFAYSRHEHNKFFIPKEDYLEKRFLTYMQYYYGVMYTDTGDEIVWNGTQLMYPQSGLITQYLGGITFEIFDIVGKIK